jgi:glycosyltransferase involved in cell wall biosynthesis
VATEGPLGWAARNWAVELGVPFTTAYHTRFPEYIRARFSWPLDATYTYLRWFHRFSHAILAPTPSVKAELEARGFRNVALWSRGVDKAFRPPAQQTRPVGGEPVFLYAGRVAVEKNLTAFLDLDLPGEKWVRRVSCRGPVRVVSDIAAFVPQVAGDGPDKEELQARYPGVKWLGMLSQAQLVDAYGAADCFVFPSTSETFGNVRPLTHAHVARISRSSEASSLAGAFGGSFVWPSYCRFPRAR